MQAIWITVAVAGLLLFLLMARRRSSSFFGLMFPPLKIAPDDELFAMAVERAKAERARLEELFAQRPRDTYVRLASENGAPAPVWLRLLELDGAQMRVGPAEGETAGAERSAPFEHLEDWQVELSDGKIRGGFTIEVQMLRAAQQYNGLPPVLAQQQMRYLDHAWNAAEDAQAGAPAAPAEGPGDA
ncbi:MAG: hypothetical protein L6R28_01410 [Planctomycetes bacterium]|nr:hypothetical protein [Planctomycetota bacterium]